MSDTISRDEFDIQDVALQSMFDAAVTSYCRAENGEQRLNYSAEIVLSLMGKAALHKSQLEAWTEFVDESFQASSYSSGDKITQRLPAIAERIKDDPKSMTRSVFGKLEERPKDPTKSASEFVVRVLRGDVRVRRSYS
jgi:hypothetical protein